jgi:hypothetical protein
MGCGELLGLSTQQRNDLVCLNASELYTVSEENDDDPI